MEMTRLIRNILIAAVLVTAVSSCDKIDASVQDDISYGVDGALRLQKKWTAVYIGRYAEEQESKSPSYIDRLSAEGTGEAMYYHIVAEHGSLAGEDQLLAAFKDGTGVGGTMGGKALIEWFKALYSLNEEHAAGLDAVLACGGPDAENGYMDYSIGSTGLYDVYIVEMLPNGHISGRYGMTELEITGTPMLSDINFLSGMNSGK